VTITADEALSALRSEGGEAKTAKAEAIEFLQEVLAEGPKPAGEVIQLAEGAGLSRKSMQSAREHLGIKPVKSSVRGSWIWALPQDTQQTQDTAS